MRLVLAMVAMVLATGAQATEWRSGLVEDEGGPVMSASVSASEGVEAPELRLFCSEGQVVNLRYAFGTDLPETAQLPVDGPVSFTFSTDKGQIAVPLQFEEMDGAYATSLAGNSPLIAMIRQGKSLSIDDPTGQYHEVSVPLTGSGKAIAALLATCR